MQEFQGSKTGSQGFLLVMDMERLQSFDRSRGAIMAVSPFLQPDLLFSPLPHPQLLPSPTGERLATPPQPHQHPTWRMCDYLQQTHTRVSLLAAKHIGTVKLQLGKSPRLVFEPPVSLMPLEEAASAALERWRGEGGETRAGFRVEHRGG